MNNIQQGASNRVRPYAFDRPLIVFKASQRASLICFAVLIVDLMYGMTHFSFFEGSWARLFFCTNLTVMFVALTKYLSWDVEVDDRWCVFLLAETPIGWTLLREGSALARARKKVEHASSDMGGYSNKLKFVMFGGTDQAAVHATLEEIARRESNLLARQHRHMAGETLDEYENDSELESAP